MRIGKFYRIAALAALALACTACPPSQKSTSLLPNKAATAPPLTASTAAPPPAAAVKPATPAIQQTQPEAKTDPAADLISQVEKEYQTGQDNYKAGHLDAAKENFDRALNLLLGSPLDMRPGPRQQAEFDREADGVNVLELQALQQVDGVTQQKSEHTRNDKANDTTVQ